MGNFFQELKRRNVYKVATIYIVASWLLLQVSDTLFPVFNYSDTAIQVVVVMLFFGFPIVVLLAWAFEVTPQGLAITQAADPDEDIVFRKRDYVVISILTVLLAVVTLQQYVIFNQAGADQLIAMSSDSRAGELLSVLTESPVNEKSIAVLVLDNLSPDPDNAYFAAGVHEEIINQLVKIGDLQVRSRTSVRRYEDSILSAADIARELNVSTLMEGSVRFADGRVRITTQLIRASDDAHLWAETYEFELDDIFAIQSDVAFKVAAAMQASLAIDEIARIESPTTASTEAYTLFLQHRYQAQEANMLATLDEDGWIQSGIRNLERAVMLDPSFAQGWAELGYVTHYKAGIGPPEEVFDLNDQARVYANRAIELDPLNIRGYVVLQGIHARRRQWEEWEAIMVKIVALPDLDGRAAYNYAMRLLTYDRFEEAYSWFDVAISKSPLLVFYREAAVASSIWGGDYTSALFKAEQYRAVGGDENAYHTFRAYALNRLGRQPESLAALNEISTEPMVVAMYVIPGYLDYLHCEAGEYDNVMEELSKLDSEIIKELRITYCAAGVGNIDEIFASYQRLMDKGFPINFGDIASAEVRSDPRFIAVKEYLDLPEK